MPKEAVATMSPERVTRFVIVCAARTGSTMLRLMLNSHPDICSHGEIFERYMRGFVGLEMGAKSPLRRWLIARRDADPARFLAEFVYLADTEKAVGFKALYSTLQEESWQSVSKALEFDREIRVIHLTRRNRLKRLISHRRAAISGVNVVLNGCEVPRIQKIILSLADVIADVDDIESKEGQFRKLFGRHPIFEIVYEDILTYGREVLDPLQEFLGVAPAALTTPSVKLGCERLTDLLADFESLRAEAVGTRYAMYFN